MYNWLIFYIKHLMKVCWMNFLTEILTIQAGLFDLEACFFTNRMSIWVGTSQKMTIQAGWPYIRGPYKRAPLYKNPKIGRISEPLVWPHCNPTMNQTHTISRHFAHEMRHFSYLGSLVRVRLGGGLLVDVRRLRGLEHPDLSPPADEKHDGTHPQDLDGD